MPTSHDVLFKQLIQTFFIEFLELFFPQVLDYLDRDSLVRLDKELLILLEEVEAENEQEQAISEEASGDANKAVSGESNATISRQNLSDSTTPSPKDFASSTSTSTSTPQMQQRITDVLMGARFKGQQTQFLIHIEHESAARKDFNRRMFEYFSTLHHKYRHKVYPIAVYSYDKPLKAGPNQYKVEFEDETFLDFRFKTVQLNRLDWQDFVNRPNPVASALMAKMKIAPNDRPRVKLACIRMLVGLPLSAGEKRLISAFVDNYLRLNQAEQGEFERELAESVPRKEQQEMLELTTSWKEEGIIEGEFQGQMRLVKRLLKRRLGEITPEQEQALNALSVERLEELGDSLLDFISPADLSQWLKATSKEGSN